MVGGNKTQVNTEREKFMTRFDCDDVGDLNKYVGCKIERKEGW